MSMFDPATYWEERLRKSPGITGVGYSSLGEYYNQWLYRVRKRVFGRVVRRLQVDWRATRVLDIGSGTGFYVRLWKQVGVGSLTGSDLTQVAVSRLREKFPDEEFCRIDIGASDPQVGGGCFNVISAFDVLFHIVDDVRYQRAIENVHSLLCPGGWFLFSDLLPHGPTQRSAHMVSRSFDQVEHLLRATGLQVVHRVPMFVVMNHPLDTRSRTHAFLWELFVHSVRNREILGYAFGAALYPLELLLTRVLDESPTTEILVCRKTSDQPPGAAAGTTKAMRPSAVV